MRLDLKPYAAPPEEIPREEIVYFGSAVRTGRKGHFITGLEDRGYPPLRQGVRYVV
jgi:hypothetical protein